MSSDAPTQSHAGLVGLVMFALVALMLHASLNTRYYSLDDVTHVSLADNTPLSRLHLPQAGATYFPVTLLSLKMDRLLFGGESPLPQSPEPEFSGVSDEGGAFVPGARIMNGVYHLFAGLLLWLFLKRILVPPGIALIVALVWIGHPTACESVCWISERKNVLAALFGFAALFVWSGNKKWRWPLVCACYALALCSKPSALGILPVLAALEILDPAGSGFAGTDLKRWATFAIRMVAPLLLTAGAIALGMYCYKHELVDPPGGTKFTAMLTDIEIFGRYAFNAFIPINLSFFYGVEPITSLFDTRVFLYGIPLALFLAGTLACSEQPHRPLCILGLLWFFGALGPSANIIALRYWMQDRYLYIALPGILLAGCLGFSGLAARFGLPGKTRLYAAAAWLAVIVVGLLVRSEFFVDSDSLELQAVEKEPRSAQAQLAAAYICRRVALQSGPGGGNPDRQTLQGAAHKCYFHFRASLTCPDRGNFVNPFKVMLSSVEILLHAGDYETASKILAGWIPPPNMTLLDKTEPGLSRQEFSTYTSGMLAHGWALLAEIRLRESLAPELPAPKRDALLKDALDAVGRSIEVNNSQLEGTIVRAKVLLQMSMNDAEKHDLPAAEEHFHLAISLLRSVPAGSPNEKVAKFLLDHAKSPK